MLPKSLLAASFEPLILALVANGESYGYELIQKIEEWSDGRIVWSANRLYPLLHDLENRGLLRAQWRDEGPGPDRKYYQLTAKGEKALAQARRDWMDVHELLVRLWGPNTSPAT